VHRAPFPESYAPEGSGEVSLTSAAGPRCRRHCRQTRATLFLLAVADCVYPVAAHVARHLFDSAARGLYGPRYAPSPTAMKSRTLPARGLKRRRQAFLIIDNPISLGAKKRERLEIRSIWSANETLSLQMSERMTSATAGTALASIAPFGDARSLDELERRPREMG
jgi:hypothetical protein